MIDLSIIDVSIGLILIYAAYSALASVILEFVSMIFRLRARNLSYALWRIFSNDNSNFRDEKKNTDSLLYQFMNHSRIKYLGKKRNNYLNKFWPNYPSYINPETFSEIVLDLVKDPNANNANFRIYNTQNDFSEYVIKIFNENKSDLIKQKHLLEKWYNETIERAIGWYKRQTKVILFIIGICIAVGFNVNTIDSINLLFKDSNTQSIINPLLTELTKYNKIHVQNLSGTDSTYRNLDEIVNEAISIYTIQKSFGTGWTNEECKDFQKHWFINIIGFLLTAIAISFGAPVWFDILNKAIKMRSSLNISKNNKVKNE